MKRIRKREDECLKMHVGKRGTETETDKVIDRLTQTEKDKNKTD